MGESFQWLSGAPSVRRARPEPSFAWLGRTPGTLGIPPIPWTDCWSPPGGTNPDDTQFVACHQQAWRDADEQCQNYNPNRYNSLDDCKTQTANVLVNARCLRFCKPTADVYRGGDPCNSAAATAYLQKQLGVTADGAFGPITSAALRKSGNTYQGLIGCTGGCPGKVPQDLCSGDCLPGFAIDPATGKCIGEPPPGNTCPSGTEFVTGKGCLTICDSNLVRNSQTGDCEEPPCAEGQVRTAPGQPCAAPPASTGRSGGGGGILGVVLLAVAALAGIGAAIAGRGGG